MSSPVTDVRVEPPTISDHSCITITVDFQFNHGHSASTIRRRSWRNFDCDKFFDDLCQSELLRNPPTDAASLIDCYNNTLYGIILTVMLLLSTSSREHMSTLRGTTASASKPKPQLVVWNARIDTTEPTAAVKPGVASLRQTLRRRHIEYWSETIIASVGDSKALWSKVNVLLKTSQSAIRWRLIYS